MVVMTEDGRRKGSDSTGKLVVIIFVLLLLLLAVSLGVDLRPPPAY